jgi:Mrp family chromosome partitioning ATPase
VERIQRALEIARSQRAAAAAVAAEQAPADTRVLPGRPAHAEPPAVTAAVVAPAQPPPVARVLSLDRSALRERRLVLPDDPGPAAHAYRMLRTQVLRQARAHKMRLIGVVSAVEGEGKTLTAANLALSVAAEPNQTALLVDLDLRQPSAARLLGTSGQGLESWFDGTVSDLARLMVRFDTLERLLLLPTQREVDGSSEVLAGPRARELLQELRERFTDCLAILDLPPVLLADDVLTIAPLLDGVLLVVSEGHTKREDVLRVRELLHGVHVLGTVLNISSESEQRGY